MLLLYILFLGSKVVFLWPFYEGVAFFLVGLLLIRLCCKLLFFSVKSGCVGAGESEAE